MIEMTLNEAQQAVNKAQRLLRIDLDPMISVVLLPEYVDTTKAVIAAARAAGTEEEPTDPATVLEIPLNPIPVDQSFIAALKGKAQGQYFTGPIRKFFDFSGLLG